GAEPDELGGCDVDPRPELRGETFAEPGVRPVRGDDQVAVRQLLGTGDLDAIAQVHADLGGAGPQQGEQRPAVDRGHAVAAAGDPLALQPDLDGIPVPPVVGQ